MLAGEREDIGVLKDSSALDSVGPVVPATAAAKRSVEMQLQSAVPAAVEPRAAASPENPRVAAVNHQADASQTLALAHRFALVLFTSFFGLLIGGFTFGWAPFEQVLTEDGVYVQLCDDGEASCDAQQLRLNLLYTVASAILDIAAYFGAIAAQKFGPRNTAVCAGFLHGLGCLLFAFSSPSADMYFPALSLLATSGMFLFMSVQSFQFAFPARASLIGAIVVGSFNSGTVATTWVKEIYHAGASLRQIFLGYLGVSGLIVLVTLLLWPHSALEPPALQTESNHAPPLPPQQEQQQHVHPATDLTASAEHAVPPVFASNNARTAPGVLSLEFAAIVSYLCIFGLHIKWYLGSVDGQVTSKGGSSSWSQFFNSFLWVGLVPMTFVSGWILHACGVSGEAQPTEQRRRSLAKALAVPALVSIVMSIAALLPQYQAQIVCMLGLPLLWNSLYAVALQFCTFVFPPEVKAWGLIILLQGPFILLVYPLDYMAVRSFNYDYNPSNALLLAAGAAWLLVVPRWIDKRARSVHPAPPTVADDKS